MASASTKSAFPFWASSCNLIHELSSESGVQGSSQLEFRWPPAIVGALIVPVGVFMFGWSCYSILLVFSRVFGVLNHDRTVMRYHMLILMGYLDAHP
ncbi:unnamed protein product [Fusarium graminearum]|uniref:Uncharacterized protein n=1 Tax=Gibberella zeae TaxID=5518 RepID=A0A4E9E3K2_GIBZA|nr:unnamed protein product [Fusarium graminearum]CAF3497436.1 unnamed protein product [Fusarium graminearum]CAG1975704.1 unnamed protein product [Fusarium graminearum]CAG1981367.1 unnamed protein product [Fusarium graminearum]